MPTWILIVVVAQFLLAIVAIIDKHIVTSEKVSKPVTYAFYVGILSSLSILIFVPSLFNLSLGGYQLPQISNLGLPSLNLIILAILAGYAFFFALLFLYKAFKQSDASDVVPIVGSGNAVFTFLISFIFLGEILTQNFIFGFVFLVIGTAVLSHFRFTFKVLGYSLFSGILYAIYYSLMKVLFNEYAFDQAFFWSRIILLLVTLTVLLIPYYKKIIFQATKKSPVRHGLWIIGNNILGGLAGIALLKATELGSVTIVQALNGLQFTFLIILSILFGKITPASFGENNKFGDVVQKIFSVTLIIIGFYLLFI
jgi:uncharacterized membrane protein